MSNPLILKATPNAISLLVSESGATRFVNQDGLTVDLFGQVVAHANPLAQQATGGALQTSAISGLPGSTSSASVALQLSLVNKLKQRLTTDGSILFKLTWKEKTTPAGRLVYRLAASARRTSDNDSGSWPTPNTMEGGQTSRGGKRKDELLMGGLVGWPTPIVGDTTGGPRPPDDKRGPAPGLQAAAHLTSWPTPNTPSGGPNVKSTPTHTGGMDLEGAVTLTNWATPTTRDHKDGACLAQITGGGGSSEQSSRTASATNGFWQAADWLPCRDGKARPVEPGTFPLAYGVSARVGRLRAYGNAIVPQVAQVFIEAYLES